jgi:L-iditol 2-dehydrogenase
MTESTTTSPALGSDRAAEQVSAVVAHRDADGLVTVHYEHKSAPTPGPGDLIVRPEFVGVCGTDLELLGGHLDGDFPISYPLTLGHEWSGTVLTVGPEVTGFSAGDLVIGHGVLGGNHWFGVTDDGAMAERFRVSARQCFRVPDGVSAQRAAMVEPLACVLAGLQSVGGADGSQLAVVFGCGTLGLAMVGLLHSTGAAVVAIDPSSQRREIAERVGADLTLAPATGSDLSEQMATVFGVAGADLVIEASGAPAAQAAALEVTGIGARVLYMGLSHGTAAQAALRLVQARQLRLSASTGAPPEVWQPALRLMGRTGLDLTPAVSTVYPFADCDQALAAAATPSSSGKIMLRP